MKSTLKYSVYLYTLIGLLFLVSCEKDKEEPILDPQYLHEYELLSTYTQQEILQKIVFAAFAFPDFDDVLNSITDGVDIYRVTYHTELNSESLLASGLVCIPKGNDTYPYLSFQNGTNTCHSNAPSNNPSDTLYTLISVMAGSGYIITIPDYIGFGESEDKLHPYHHKPSSNSSVIDLLNAADELLQTLGTASKASNDLMLLGYSQGGWATMAVLSELENNEIHGYSVKAAACGAGAYDLYSMSEHVLGLEEYGNPFYLPYFIESRIQNSLLENPLTDYFNEPYATTIPGLFDGSLCNTEMNDQFPKEMALLMKADMLTDFATASKFESLRDELVSNSVEAWNLNAKLRMYHSKGDNSVPSFLSRNLYDDFISMGVSTNKIEFIEIDFLDHNDAVLPWGMDAISWLNTVK